MYDGPWCSRTATKFALMGALLHISAVLKSGLAAMASSGWSVNSRTSAQLWRDVLVIPIPTIDAGNRLRDEGGKNNKGMQRKCAKIQNPMSQNGDKAR